VIGRVALIIASIVVASCASAGPAKRTVDPNGDVVVPYSVDGGGIVRFTVRPQYVAGQQIAVTLDVVAGSVGIRGPLSGRVQTVGTSGESVVRMLAPTELDAVDVRPRASAHTVVRWDGRDDAGVPLVPETYSLALDFIVGTQSFRFGTVVQIVAQ
jgi:hypothetical protein